MQYACNMAHSLSHEDKQLISSADNQKYTSLFYLKHSQITLGDNQPEKLPPDVYNDDTELVES